MSSTTPEGDEPDTIGARFLVSGAVQGVGFRWWTRLEALRLGVTGKVRNRSDGSVEVVAFGTSEQIEKLHELLQRGPPPASVRTVERMGVGDEPAAGFHIEH